MKKILIVILFLSFGLSGCNNNISNTQDENNNYNTSRISSTNNVYDTNNLSANNNTESNNTVSNDVNSTNIVNSETELSSFSTKIYTPNDKARQNNIKITCSKLDGTIIKSRRNFFLL